ncbi:ArsR family transcriptional regulator [Nonomuraea fuscirosea]|uniref:ArsR family transcriptional regulator n=1 Tax=Nonomuraea fuscirosea TaxID=1291556 RepID=UPI003F4D8CAC
MTFATPSAHSPSYEGVQRSSTRTCGGTLTAFVARGAFELSQPTVSHHLKVLKEVRAADLGAARLLGVLPTGAREAGRVVGLAHPARHH